MATKAEPQPIEIACGWCASTDVARDAWAEWDVDRQEWVLGRVMDDGWCFACERERELTERDCAKIVVTSARQLIDSRDNSTEIGWLRDATA